jgi:biopolymer transport protein TolQ
MLQQGAGGSGAGIPAGPLELITAGSAATKAVLVLLLVLSLLSWGVMLAKWFEFRRVEAAGRAFVRAVERARSVQGAEEAAAVAMPTPFTDVFHRAMRFLTETRPALGPTSDRGARLSQPQVEALRLVLESEADLGRDRLGRLVSWLATIGSVSPLVGLFGTVLGVISAFTGIAAKGSGNLGAVAPASRRRSWPRPRRWPSPSRPCSATTCSPRG